MISTMRFKLVLDADEDAFVAADKALQTGFAYKQPGLLRRTTARATDGTFVVIDLWRSARDADRCDARWEADPLVSDFMAFVDLASLETERYDEVR